MAGEISFQVLNGLLCDPAERAAPARVNRRHCAIPGVDHQNWNAIGGLHAHQLTRRVLDKRVSIADTAAASAGAHDDIGMDLVQRGEPVRRPETFRTAGSEPVLQPLELIESADSIDLMGIFVEHGPAPTPGSESERS